MDSDFMRNYILELYEQCQPLLENPDTIPETIEKLKLILRVDSTYAPAHFSLGKAYYRLENIEEATRYFQMAKELDYPQEEINDFIIEIISQERPSSVESKETKVDEEKSVSITESPERIPEGLVTEQSVTTLLYSNKAKIFLIYIIIATIVSYFSRNFLTEGYLGGWDSMSHVFKTWFTMESFAGRSSLDWCEYWYQGSPIMPMYAPLFYVTSALFAIITRLNALEASKWIVFLSYSLSALSFYYFTKRDQFDIASIAGSILYGLIPWHFSYVIVLGNPTYALCYLFLPPLFKYVRGSTQFDLVLSSLAFSLTTLSHQGTGFLLAYVLLWYHLFTGIINRNFRKSLMKLGLLGVLSAGLLSFFWIPYAYYSSTISSFQVPFQPVYEAVGQLLQQDHFMYLGSPIILILIASMSIVLISRNREGIVFSLITLLSFIITFGYHDPTVKIIYPFAKLIGPGYRFNILISFTISMVLNIALKEIPGIIEKVKILKINETRITQIQFILLIFTTILTISAFLPISNFYNPSIPDSHSSLYSLLSIEDENVRAWWLPRGAKEAALPMFTGLSTPDGWYDQGARPEDVALIHELADIQLRENPEYFVDQLEVLSVRYLVITGSQLYNPLKTIEKLELVEELQGIALFRVKHIDQLTVNLKPSSVRLYKITGIIVSVMVVAGIIYYNYRYKINSSSITRRNLTRAVTIIGTVLRTY
jgi:tetratricopeptide (TPR) repeat protein